MEFPQDGVPSGELIGRMKERKQRDADWHSGRTFSLVYPAGEDVDAVLAEASRLYLFENPLNPSKFPSVRQMERDVVSMTGAMLNAPDDFGGAMTSGGTESILLAVKSARDWAREHKPVGRPTMIVPHSAHPAFAKAAHFFGLHYVQSPLGEDLRADVAATRDLIDENTVFMAGSAPCYPFGVVDPIEDLAALADDNDVWFHTDSCLGGFLLPFLEQNGEAIPAFDFRVRGVRTMSADVHKYGYCFKGASVVLHRSKETLLRHQAFAFDNWPGGAYGTLSNAGARPAGPIAGAWAVMHYLGADGYRQRQRVVLDAARAIRRGIEDAGLQMLGDPIASVMAFASPDGGPDIMAVGDQMDDRGWHLDRQSPPAALHMMVSPIHERIVGEFVADIAAAVASAGTARGGKATYAE